jgi:hypothetical protein
MDHVRYLTIARARSPPFYCDESVAEIASGLRPPRQSPSLRRRHQNAAQYREMLARAANSAETLHKHGHHYRSCREVVSFDGELQGKSVGAQNHVLAAAGFDQKVLEAWQARKEDTGTSGVWAVNPVRNGRQYPSARRRQPHVPRLERGPGGVRESSRAPTLPQEPCSLASA